MVPHRDALKAIYLRALGIEMMQSALLSACASMVAAIYPSRAVLGLIRYKRLGEVLWCVVENHQNEFARINIHTF